MDTSPDLSILIPCYNEADVIEATVGNLIAALASTSIRFEILCVNNASTDQTERVLRDLSARYPEVRYVNTPDVQGYGVAVRWGLEFFRGKSVAIVMADGSETPADVIAFYRKIEEGFDCAFGTRFSPGTEVTEYPPFKLALNRLGNKLIAWITGVDYNDFTNGFKCYRREVITAMQPLFAEHFNLTTEMAINTVMAGAKFAVVPNSWKGRSGGASKFKILKQAKLYLLTLAYCWLRARIQGETWTAFSRELAARRTELTVPQSQAANIGQ